jgi:GxxExxY protein
MPVHVHAPIRQLAEEEFSRVVYGVMRHVFEVRNEFGRCFDERTYQREIARRCGGQTEVPVEVCHGSFRKLYYLDLVVEQGAVFEIKMAVAVSARHRSQLLQYLQLAELPCGKLVNLGGRSVSHEFVNNRLTLAERTRFEIDDALWDQSSADAADLQRQCVGLLRDVGTGLTSALYEEALICLLGGAGRVNCDVPIMSGTDQISSQQLPLIAATAALRLTTFDDDGRSRFASHLLRFLEHTPLESRTGSTFIGET